MKNTILLLYIYLLSSSTGFSQTQKAERYLGGSLRFGIDKTKFENGNQTQFNNLDARVDFGKFVNDDFAIGGALQVNREASAKGIKSRTFHPKLLSTARYYAGKEKAKIFLAGQLGLSVSRSSHLEFAGTNNENRIGITQVGGAYGIGAGVAWFLNSVFAVEGTIGWEGISLPKTKSNMSFTGLKIGLTGFLGAGEINSSPNNNNRKIGVGISIFDGLGVPIRYYLSPEKVLEGGIYYGGIVIPNSDEIELASGLMFGSGFTFFGKPLEKEKKRKIRANGLALRLNYLTGDYPTTLLSAGWAVESYKKDHPKRSFIFELGLRGQFPNYELDGETVKVTPSPYLRCHWNFFVK